MDKQKSKNASPAADTKRKSELTPRRTTKSPAKTETPIAAAAAADTAMQSKEDDDVNYEKKVLCVAPIAQPLASRELNKRLLRVIRKAAKNKDVKRGVKEVVKVIRKQLHKRATRGVLVVFAGNISPIDVITHVPVICEDNDVPYVYVPAKEDLGEAAQTKRPTSCVMILAKKDADYLDSFDKCVKEIKLLSSSR